MPNLVFLAHRPSLQILSKTQMGVFPISGQSFIKRNRRNSRTSDDIDMKHGPVTKLDKRNKTSKKFDDDVMPGNCDAIAIFPIYGQFEAIRKLDYPNPPPPPPPPFKNVMKSFYLSFCFMACKLTPLVSCSLRSL